MDTFFMILKRSLVVVMFVIFGFTTTYVPHTFNKVETAEALFGGDFVWDPGNFVQNLATNISTTATAVYGAISSAATFLMKQKELVLDGLAWVFAKAVISNMIDSLVSWINSGFQGSPMFVQDLQGFLLSVADETMGEYISELGAIGSLICDPFKLDVQLAVAIQYEHVRVGENVDKCTLTGIIDNITAFTSGQPGSFSQGGWDDWFDITSSPNKYTPFGSVLTAQDRGAIRLLNKKGEEVEILGFGDGFMSNKICENVSGGSQKCFISTPGKAISSALNSHLDSGRESLVAADEINEVLVALFEQLAKTAIGGAKGLLGLTGGTGHTYDGYDGGSYLGTLEDSTSEDTSFRVLDDMEKDIEFLGIYKDEAETYLALLTEFAEAADDFGVLTNNPAAINQAITDIADIEVILGKIDNDITTLRNAITNYTSLDATPADKLNIVNTYARLSIYTEADLVTSRNLWNYTLSNPSF